MRWTMDEEATVPVRNETQLPLFAEVRQLLEPYRETFAARRDEPGHVDLWSEKDVVIAGRQKNEVFFAGLIVQKSYASFSFVPVYADGDSRAAFGPDLLECLAPEVVEVAGVCPDICVLRTVCDLCIRGHEVQVSHDLVETYDAPGHEAGEMNRIALAHVHDVLGATVT